MSDERRKHKRYRVKNGALALIDNVPGTIVDISDGGLTVNYTVFGNEPNVNFRLDIFLSEDDFYLHDIPVTVVSSASKRNSTASIDPIQIKRFGLRFGELTDQQRSNLRYFIMHNTVAEG